MQRPVHGSSGFTCRHQMGVAFGCTRGIACILLRATRSALAPRWQGVARWARVPLLVRTGILAVLDPVEVAWLQRLEPFLDLGGVVTLPGADLGLLGHLDGPGLVYDLLLHEDRGAHPQRQGNGVRRA